MIRLKNTSTKWFLLIQYICYNKKSLFQQVAFKVYAITKIIASNGCYEPVPEVVNNKNSLLFQVVVMNIIRKQSPRGVP